MEENKVAENVYQGLAMGIFPVICKHRKRFYVLEDSGLPSKTVLRPPRPRGFQCCMSLKCTVSEISTTFHFKEVTGMERVTGRERTARPDHGALCPNAQYVTAATRPKVLLKRRPARM